MDNSTLQLHDTLSRKAHEILPEDGKTIGMYCCGPTVYGPAHIGNFRAFVVQDVLRRVLELSGWKTKHVRNITDVDDKTIRDSQAAGLPLQEFTDGWRDKFHEDGVKLGLLKPHIEPSAVEHIPEQIEMIKGLIEKGNAYASEDGSVYFKISSYPEYGKLSHLDQREVQEGASGRVVQDADEYKDGVNDFVLWKGRKEADGENYWESPWGEGRPGWHLECSAMSHKYLGEEFEIHAGGVDLVFPHHENEIAQSCCSSGKGFAKHWFHNAHLMVDGGKMAKSIGNLYTISDLEEKGYEPMEVRYVLVSGLYRQQLNFRLQSLDDARSAMGRVAKFAETLRETADISGEAPDFRELASYRELEYFNEAWGSLLDDLNTPSALGNLFTQIKNLNPNDLSSKQAEKAWLELHFVLGALGLTLPVMEQEEAPQEIVDLANERLEAKSAKDWESSDRLRDEIIALGWSVQDSPDGFELNKL